MSDVSTGVEQLRDSAIQEPRQEAASGGVQQYLATGLALLAICVDTFPGVADGIQPSHHLRGCAVRRLSGCRGEGIKPVIQLGRVSRMTLVLLLLAAASGLGLVWGVGKLPEQTRLLLKVMDTQFDLLQRHLVTYGVDLLGPEWGRDFTQWLFSDQGRFFSHARLVLGGASSLSDRRARDRVPRDPLCLRSRKLSRQPGRCW